MRATRPSTDKSQQARAGAEERESKKMFSNIELWIDDARGVSVQQKFIEAESGDYRLAKYSNIKINEKLSDEISSFAPPARPKWSTRLRDSEPSPAGQLTKNWKQSRSCRRLRPRVFWRPPRQAMAMSKVFVIPVVPSKLRGHKARKGDDSYIEGQRLLVEAMKYLAKDDPTGEPHRDRTAVGALPYPVPHDRPAELAFSVRPVIRPQAASSQIRHRDDIRRVVHSCGSGGVQCASNSRSC